MTGLLFSDALSLLKEGRVPLIIIPRSPSTDALAAGLGLLIALERAGKSPHLVSPDFQLPPNHGFLPKSEAVQKSLTSLRSFIISINTKQTKLDSLSYDLAGDQARIYLSPKNGYFEPKDITTSPGAFAYDLIISIGLSTWADLGELYEQNAEFFYQTPTIAIDHHPANARFGQVNLVDVVASSSSEVVFELIQQLDANLLDEQVATNLLAGIISNTKGFQTHTVTPRSLSVASHLISAGARRDEIVRHLYQTKTLAALKVWGRALSSIRSSASGRVVWSTLSREDLRQTGGTAAEAAGALDELIVNTPSASATALFIETERGIRAHVSLAVAADVGLPAELVPETTTYYTGTIPGTLREVADRIVGILEQKK